MFIQIKVIGNCHSSQVEILKLPVFVNFSSSSYHQENIWNKYDMCIYELSTPTMIYVTTHTYTSVLSSSGFFSQLSHLVSFLNFPTWFPSCLLTEEYQTGKLDKNPDDGNMYTSYRNCKEYLKQFLK